MDSTDLSHVRAHWYRRADGALVAQGSLALPKVPPHTAVEVTPPPEARTVANGGCHQLLDIGFTLAEERFWAPASFEVAFAQLELTPLSAMLQSAPKRSLGRCGFRKVAENADSIDQELVRHPGTVWHLDHKQHGIGTASCGPRPMQQYHPLARAMAFAFDLVPFDGQAEDPGTAARR